MGVTHCNLKIRVLPLKAMECGQSHRPFFGHGVGPVAMEHAEVKLLLCREMPHTGYERLPERPVIRPFGKDFVV